MDKEMIAYVSKKSQDMMNAASCSNDAKQSAKAWLAAIGTKDEAAATKKYIADLKGDIMPLPMLIDFAGSKDGEKVFGADTAKKIKDHAVAIKAAGQKYCDCAACAAVAAILTKLKADF